MWRKNFETEDEVYSRIIKDMNDAFKGKFPDEAIDFIGDEIMKAKFDSNNAVHCFFSPSKSNGWAVCPAYLDRAVPWDGSKEPAIRGTIAHHFLSKMIEYLKSGKYSKEEDYVNALVLQNPQWLSETGIASVNELLKKVIELGISETQSEVFLMSKELGFPNKALRFGGSIDILHIKELVSETGLKYADVYIYDLKTGKNKVPPSSWQLKCYALLVRDHIMETRDVGWCEFVLGISQNGKIEECVFSNQQEQAEAFIHIKRAMKSYKDVYLENRLNVDKDFSKEEQYPECFEPCSYCRFCKGCYKRDLVMY